MLAMLAFFIVLYRLDYLSLIKKVLHIYISFYVLSVYVYAVLYMQQRLTDRPTISFIHHLQRFNDFNDFN